MTHPVSRAATRSPNPSFSNRHVFERVFPFTVRFQIDPLDYPTSANATGYAAQSTVRLALLTETFPDDGPTLTPTWVLTL